ncbi:DUF962 domain-containing protein [Moraxella catarrhalis]|uniref:DUF962 domain-containing protein n=1 Tax=Moraxella catarrhalis TaxID=480 RepID=UPI00217E107F|nr:DUF962 domain-containing protein [Moraxella catarrhalis]
MAIVSKRSTKGIVIPLFSSQKPLKTWLNDYATSHQNPTNKRIHWLCVPIILMHCYTD